MRHLPLPFGSRSLSVLLLATSAAQAQEQPLSAREQRIAAEQWRTVSSEMSPQEYRRAYRHNQRLVRDAVKSYSEDALRSAGVPETGIRLLGVAAGLAVDGDARLSLHRSGSRRLALEFKELVDGDPSVQLGIRLKW